MHRPRCSSGSPHIGKNRAPLASQRRMGGSFLSGERCLKLENMLRFVCQFKLAVSRETDGRESEL